MPLASEVTSAAKTVEDGVKDVWQKTLAVFGTVPADLKDDFDRLAGDAATATTTAVQHEADAVVAKVDPTAAAEVDPLIAEGLALLESTLKAKLAAVQAKIRAPA